MFVLNLNIKLKIYKNGNCTISLEDDGTRTLQYDGELKLVQPLNIDIRISSSCSFADNVCKNFCHEEAVVNGKTCDYEELKKHLSILSSGIELAVGVNKFDNDVLEFFKWNKEQGFVTNITINQGHILRDLEFIQTAVTNKLINGLGISYRSSLNWNVPQEILSNPNTVFNVIVGINSINDVKELSNKGVKKICILGEKDFGYNKGKVDSSKHKEWKWRLQELFEIFDIVSFDNLAVEQLVVKRFFNEKTWLEFYNGEHSFYIDAVNKILKPSSRSSESISWEKINLLKYFEMIDK